jgi:5-methyltetrahydrofolate--homocysteine methyltransferase
MSKLVHDPSGLIIIGENIHTTRIVLRNGKRTETAPDGAEAVFFDPSPGERRHLRVPESFKKTQPYEQGQIKHFMIAVQKGISGDPMEEAEGTAYIEFEVRRQEAAGAHFLDLNVDEISYDIKIQKRAMAWLVERVQEMTVLPLSIDSSNAEIIAAGLVAHTRRSDRPLVNSVALERLETLDLVQENDARMIVTAAGKEGMPESSDDRVSNVEQVMEAVVRRGFPLDDVYIDCLVFPISVSPEFGRHFLDAVEEVRRIFGNDVHVTGGLSNVSFGLPNRKLINATFIHLSLEVGIDAAIMDPVQNRVQDVFALDLNSEKVGLARDMLLGRDDFCMNYIQAWRAGRLSGT